MNSMVNIDQAEVQPISIPELSEKKLRADVLRLDKIHPVLSGNKWFKLKYHLQEAAAKNSQLVLTFGGAWSNHIIATAYAARESGFGSIGIIRGDEPSRLSHTLFAAKDLGMQLVFVSRATYARKTDDRYVHSLINNYGNVYIIPEGGGGPQGLRGSEEILSLAEPHKYSHVICCIGSGTMYAGLINSATAGQKIIGIPVLKGIQTLRELNISPKNDAMKNECKLEPGYHFGGYARKTARLLEFMNDFYNKTSIPTDFVYTGKLMFALTDLVKKNYFPPESNILVIHSGGLQGNTSLPAGTLVF